MTSENTTITNESPLSAIRYASGTDIGQRREENQDSFGAIENEKFKLYIVADGMGGVKGGGVASNICVNVMKECLEDKHELTSQAICSAVEHANTEIFEKGSADASLAGMGTTFVGLGFVDTRLFISSVGDSRAYRIRDNHITQLTTDHTLVQELLRSGAITLEQADNHPVSHMLTRSLGPTPSVEVDCWLCGDGPARGDIYMICSDGLYNLVQSDEIASILQDNYIDVAVQKLIKLANDRGGTDNITIIAVEVDENFPVGPEVFEGVIDTAAPRNQLDQSNQSSDRAPVENIETNSQASIVQNINEAHINGVQATPGVAIIPPDSPEVQSHLNISEAKLNSEKLIAPVAGSLDSLSVDSSSADGLTESKVQASPFTAALFKASPIPRALMLGGAFAVVTLIGFVGGFYAPKLLGGGDHQKSNSYSSVPEFPQAQVARLEPELQVATKSSTLDPASRMAIQELQPLRDTEQLELQQQQGSRDVLSANHDHGVAPEELARISRRKAALQQVVTEIEAKIAAFDAPISSKLPETLKQSREQREQLELQQEDLRSQIDVATRKLAVWYGRRKRFQSTDAINLASEVAVASPEVKDSKEVFELATWSYLKEAEVLRYNPSDVAQERKVADLAKLRKDRQRELGEQVKKAIEKEVADSDKSIAELTFKRDRILATIENIRRDEEYVKILMGNDPKAKDNKRKEFIRERDLAKSELEELTQLLPDGEVLTPD